MATTNQKSLVESVPKGLLIGGRWRDSSDGATLTVEDPSDGSTLAEVADATVADGKAALDAAVAAQGDWAATPPRDRSRWARRCSSPGAR
jgi:succinate-semialdehyde dehydrogenase/glutarate-semialdehyde dehydrogenase